MKTSFNMVKASLTATLCLGLLAACDNRSVTPFKSKTWSKEELAANKALTGEPSGVRPDVVNVNPLPNGESPLVTPAAPKPAPQPGKENAPNVDVGGAQSKFPVEFKDREKEQLKTAKFEVLKNTVDELIKKGLDKDAADMVAAISITAESKPELNLSVKAALNLNGKAEYLLIERAKILAPTQEHDIFPLTAELHQKGTFEDAKHEIGNSLYAWSFCLQENCETLYLILDMKHPSGVRKNALFTMLKKGDKYELVTSNVGNPADLKPFEGVAVLDKAEDKNEEKNAETTDKGGEATIPKNDKGAVEKDGSKSSEPTDVGTAGKDAQKPGPTEEKPSAPFEKQGAVDGKVAPANFFPGGASVDKKDGRMLGAKPDILKRSTYQTRTNLAELSRNANVKQEFTITPKPSETNTKSVLFQKADASKVAATVAVKPAPVAKIDVTQVVKAPLKVDGVDVFARNKALAAAQTNAAAAKPLAMLPRTTGNNATAATTPAATSVTTSTATASTATPTTNAALRTRARVGTLKKEAAARKLEEAKKGVIQSAEAQ